MNTLLVVIVLGVLMLALIVDVAALLDWLQSRWQRVRR